MSRKLRRQLRLLQIYAVGSFLFLVFLGATAMTQSGVSPAKFDEITVGRINVVDGNGTLRLVISNKDRMHPGVMDGKMINRPRPVAGLLFFNDVGDEVGGLTISGQEVNGKGRANGGIMFDQWKQDQTVGISYNEDAGQRTAGLQVWDRSPDVRLSELIGKLNTANAIADPGARAAAVQAARAGAPPGPQRVFVGKTRDRASSVILSDASGKPRLNLKVEADGSASIEFLDAEGKVVERLPKR
jgi:hypothetical protein